MGIQLEKGGGILHDLQHTWKGIVKLCLLLEVVLGFMNLSLKFVHMMSDSNLESTLQRFLKLERFMNLQGFMILQGLINIQGFSKDEYPNIHESPMVHESPLVY